MLAFWQELPYAIFKHVNFFYHEFIPAVFSLGECMFANAGVLDQGIIWRPVCRVNIQIWLIIYHWPAAASGACMCVYTCIYLGMCVCMYSTVYLPLHLALAISIFDLSLLNKHLAKFILSFSGVMLKEQWRVLSFYLLKRSSTVGISVRKTGELSH